MPIVSTVSSGRAGDEPSELGGISSDSYSGCLRAIVSETSMGRKVGSPRSRAVDSIASEMTLLSSGPTVMNASSDGSRAISATWSGLKWTIATFAGLTPDSVRMTRSSVALTSVRPTTAMRRPARSPMVLTLDLAPLFAPFGASAGPEHDDIFPQDGNGFGAVGHLLVGARDREIGLAGAEQRNAVDRSGGGDHGEPDLVSVPAKGLRQRFDELQVIASRRAYGNSQGGWPQCPVG